MLNLIRTKEQFDAVKLDFDRPLMVDTETCHDLGRTLKTNSSPGGLYGKIRLIQTYQKGDKQALLFDCFFLDLKDVLDLIQPHHHVYHNASFDLHTINCHTAEYWYPNKVDDTFYLSKAAFPKGERFNFYECLKHAKLEDDNIRGIDKKANQKAEWDKDLTLIMLKYAAMDVLYLSLLYDAVKTAADEPYYLDVMNLKYAVRYDRRGIPINEEAIAVLRRETLMKLEHYIPLLPVNPNSPKQCQEWLGVDSTNAYVIGTMALKGNQDAENLVQARKAMKQLQFINKYDNGRIIGFHNACGARTSRMTCTGGDMVFADNTQNTPRPLYPCIQAKEGKEIIYNDYAGLELRTGVAFVGEPLMYRLMMDGTDLHTYTACQIFNVTPETLDPQQRWVTKVFTFSNVYGAGPVELQNQLQAKGRIHMEIDEVKDIQKKWFDLYHYFKEWHRMHRKMIGVYGYIDIETLLGRKMRAYRINDTFNFPIQGSAAEVTKLAVHLLFEEAKKDGEIPPIINVVHDSISLEDYKNKADYWIKLLNKTMVEAWYRVIEKSAMPDLVMPGEAQAHKMWPGIDDEIEDLIKRGVYSE